MKSISVLGSTGSIGRQTLDAVRAHPEEFELVAISANRSVDEILAQVREFRPQLVCVTDENAARQVEKALPRGTRLCAGADAPNAAATMQEADIVVNGISGFSGTKPLISALAAGKPVALANKESIVCAHTIVNKTLGYGGKIIPVDSEQSAIFQCLACGKHDEVRRLILTASGGPFRGYSKEMLERVTPEQARKHPTWSMGEKITVDSATLFNKGLEIMEASYLFDVPGERIDVFVHPESIVHSMVEFCDSAVMAQLSLPDMRLAIYHALTYPERHESDFGRISIEKMAKLTFEKPDRVAFPAIDLAYAALAEGNVLPIVYNGANEAAVREFLAGRTGFCDIARRVEFAMTHIGAGRGAIGSFDDVIEIDRAARALAVSFSA